MTQRLNAVAGLGFLLLLAHCMGFACSQAIGANRLGRGPPLTKGQ